MQPALQFGHGFPYPHRNESVSMHLGITMSNKNRRRALPAPITMKRVGGVSPLAPRPYFHISN